MKTLITRMTLFGVMVLAGCSTNHFPEPKSMEPMVEFWERVYSEWNENQAIYHDNRYLSVIYDVVPVPNQDRRDFLRANENILREELVDMVARYQNKEKLTRNQRHWVKLLKKAGGEAAIYGAPERLRYQTGLKNNFRKGLEISGRYLPEFKAIMKRHNVPEEIAYLPHVESSFQGRAYSHVGAAGMWQFMPSTARDYMPMQRNVIDGRLDPFMAAEGAARYLGAANQRTQAWPLALTGYNHGVGGMVRAKNQLGTDDIGKIVWQYQGDRFGFASRNFYAEFLAAKRIADNSNSYFPGLHPQKPRKVDAITLNAPIKVRDLANALMISEIDLIELNPAWLKNIQINQAAIPANIPVWLPKGTAKRMPQDIGRVYDKR
ncbi:lytic transglycosylase domain-containing protein [Wohlfahrtiimonas chitiniclastica]|uniref:lytic transglycosylase domain-containing protein n=1 Tax=Wohlfahrtiimonas chitiniclastica TaxID=400946 RepID=UPI001BD14108|nr:lytic transglycosylase domain-containing protein [Wohlfahrtiimonas chitiniclastica]MBS7817380.1 lytic transglycosylase domain-containing protein [Wohlfahrtiimonas chitiniclastica]MBS7823046.1 lytic transglycosylase domain-containing protein [Wohlfahrtiimonas chitiniclastica]MBS7830860.1 lytic transglycosylase domain-containing protein [Wohlfahrtiimonas chitiniclastica]MBS7832828.1 lytic transglycosylase domain-containing protein [Wohlfahrtiimonas chitiniclastica]